jgi:hypothetical protein
MPPGIILGGINGIFNSILHFLVLLFGVLLYVSMAGIIGQNKTPPGNMVSRAIFAFNHCLDADVSGGAKMYQIGRVENVRQKLE